MTCAWTKCIGTPLLNRTQIGADRLAQIGSAGLTPLVEVEGEILRSRDAMRTATPVTNRGIWRHATPQVRMLPKDESRPQAQPSQPSDPEDDREHGFIRQAIGPLDDRCVSRRDHG